MSELVHVSAIATQTGTPLSRIMAFHAGRDPDRPCLTVGERTIGRRALDETSNGLAWTFRRLGVKPGDLVTIALPNSIELCLAIFAAWKCGAVPHMMSYRMPPHEAQGLVDLVDPPVVVGGPDGLVARGRLSEADIAAVLPRKEALPEAHVSPHWKAISSGGSTGRPKVIVAHKPANFDPLAPVMGQSIDGTVLIPGPLYNNGPFMGAMLTMFIGCHVVLTGKFDPEETLRLLDRHKVDWAFFVPTMMGRMAKLSPEIRERYDLSHLNMVLHSASMCPAWVKQAWIDWIGPEKILEGYGGTEAQGLTFITGTEWLDHKGSVGRPMPGSKVLILDPEGRALPPGEVGEIFFLPDDPETKSYHYIGAERREVGAAGSVGDMGWLDADGWLYIADRRTDMIVSGGANIYPAEIEGALEAHPSILSSLVIGLPDDDLIATAHALVQLDPDQPPVDEDAIKTWLKERIAVFKLPRSFEFVSESLRDDAGKARRSQIREERISAKTSA